MNANAQLIRWDRGEVLTLGFALLASQYPVGTTFSWKFQVTSGSDSSVVFNATGNVTVSSGLTLSVPISESNTLATDVGTHGFTLWDTTNKRTLAKGVVQVGKSQM
jgi:hypothetical protein